MNLKIESVSIRKIAKLLNQLKKMVRNFCKPDKKYRIKARTKGNLLLVKTRKEATGNHLNSS